MVVSHDKTTDVCYRYVALTMRSVIVIVFNLDAVSRAYVSEWRRKVKISMINDDQVARDSY